MNVDRNMFFINVCPDKFLKKSQNNHLEIWISLEDLIKNPTGGRGWEESAHSPSRNRVNKESKSSHVCVRQHG